MSEIVVRGSGPGGNVEKELAQMLKAISGAINELFTVSDAHYCQWEKGWYVSIYAKPRPRVAASLSIDREVLILLNNFAEQQPRIISFAQQEIAAHKARLEPRFAILIQQDPEATQKLKGWAREQSVSVLPVFCDGRRDVTADSFQRQITKELFSNDPFDITGPVVDDVQFFGRRDEAIDIARQLQKSQIRACFGIRKSGKTSILSRVAKVLETSDQVRVLFIDCSRDDICQMSPGKLMASIARAAEIVSRTGRRYSAVSPANAEVDISSASQSFAAALRAEQSPLIVIFDEIDYISPNGPVAKHWDSDFNLFWRNMRSVYQEAVRSSQTLSLYVGGVSSKWFAVESINGVENAALAFVPEEYLGPFARGATHAMLRRLSLRAGLQFNQESIDAIAAACSDIPFWVRRAASFMHKRVPIESRPCEVDTSLAESLLEQFIASDGVALASVAIKHLRRVYPELWSALLLYHNGESERASPHLVRSLASYGLVNSGGISGRLVGEAVKEVLASPQEEAISRKSDDSASEIGQWAEDLAVVNKERNAIERKMRSTIAESLRWHAIQNKQLSASPKDLLLRGLPEARRVALGGYDMDVLVTKLYWKELSGVVCKHWDVFVHVFKDKVRFVTAMEIANDRPDTHAKEFDAADLALQRRELAWIKKQLDF